MRVLILGGGGMLGHKVASTFQRDFDTWVTLRRSADVYKRCGIFNAQQTLSGIDVFNFDSVIDAVAKVRPDVVINCIGLIKQLPEAEDRVLSVTVNSLLPHRLARLCQATGARLVHISTDCVFSGKKGMYREDDQPDADDVYGRTKVLGETTGTNALTLRTSLIGREIESQNGLVEWFLSRKGSQVKGYTRAIFSGFTTQTVSRILRMILLEQPTLSGTLHVASDPISKFDLLTLLQKAYGIDVDIVPDDQVRIDRSLDGSRFAALTGFVPPAWAAAIEELAGDATPYDEWRRG